MRRSWKAYRLVQELVQVVPEEQVPRPWWSIVVVLEAEYRHFLPSLYIEAVQFFVLRGSFELFIIGCQLPTLKRKFFSIRIAKLL